VENQSPAKRRTVTRVSRLDAELGGGLVTATRTSPFTSPAPARSVAVLDTGKERYGASARRP